jgi:hypothetical protein
MERSSKRSAAEEESASIGSDEVAQVAYQLFEQRGRIHGFDRQDWLRAEQLVRQRRRRANNGG